MTESTLPLIFLGVANWNAAKVRAKGYRRLAGLKFEAGGSEHGDEPFKFPIPDGFLVWINGPNAPAMSGPRCNNPS